MLVDKGCGPAHDYLHLHYRSAATLIAMGADPVDSLRQMKNVASDPYSGGRNFAGHYAKFDWNVVPVSSPIEVQFSMAPGTAMAQKRHGGRGITIVQGGDAGTAEGDFPTCLVWSSRPANELPVLMIVTNNYYGISTPSAGQHGGEANRRSRQGVRDREHGHRRQRSGELVSPAEEGDGLRCEAKRKPFLLEAVVSRLHGHSSSSGANYVTDEVDCLTEFEKKLEERKIAPKSHFEQLRERYTQMLLDASKRVREEAMPTEESAFDHVFATENKVGAVAGGVR